MATEGKVSIVDSTQRLEWELTKETYDSCAFPHYLSSPVFKIQVGKEESKWQMNIWPKGYANNEDSTVFSLRLFPANVKYFVQANLGFKTSDGKFLFDGVEKLYANSRRLTRWKAMQKSFDGNGTSEDRTGVCGYSKGLYRQLLFANDSLDTIILVATLVIYVEGENYIPQREMATNFAANHRSIKDLEMFSDFTIVCGGMRFKCHRLVLASMSSIFKTMLTNDHFVENKDRVVEIVDSTPKMVAAMLFFINNGIIPNNIDAIASDLIHLAEKYDLQDLMKACERSLANNVAVENVIDTLITLDLYSPTSEFRQKIIDFIKSNAEEVIKVKDWIKFVQNYPSLVTELFLSFANQH